jgi:hypothetical protein
MTAKTEGRQVRYSDYEILNQLKKYNSKRLCELAIIKIKEELNLSIPNLEITYDKNEHKELWNEISSVFNQEYEEFDFFKYFHDFISQFSPDSNVYTESNANHIKHYVKTASEIVKNIGFSKQESIIEFGANNGILSLALQLFGQSVFCTDLHHGIVSNSINSYRVGTWIRENFIGVNVCDTFKFKEDDISNLRVFDNGIDTVVMRGTGILTLNNTNARRRFISRVLNKVKRSVLRNNKESRIKTVENNIQELAGIINPNGMIFAKNENIFCGFEMSERVEMLEQLKDKLSNECDLQFKIEEGKYINGDWEDFNITIICKKTMKSGHGA